MHVYFDFGISTGKLDFVKIFTHVKNFQLHFFLDTSGWWLIDLTWVLGDVEEGF